MIQYQKSNLCTKFEPHGTSSPKDIIFQKYGRDVTMITS